MQRISTIAALRETLADWRRQDETIGFVPTMGNLHAGHLRLVEVARSRTSRLVVSIFVNPLQFGPTEDLANYPRTLEADAAALRDAGVNVLFTPEVGEIYPKPLEQMSVVDVPELSGELCGQFRPGHFRGVATVVLKLFNLVQPDLACFGEKDFQQLAVIRRMVADLNLPVEIVGVPTVREPSGLALSSRNGYLSDEQKRQAAQLYAILNAAAGQLRSGRRDFTAIEAESLQTLQQAGFRPDYFAIRRADDLQSPTVTDRQLVILVAAHLGPARLIDNLSLIL